MNDPNQPHRERDPGEDQVAVLTEDGDLASSADGEAFVIECPAETKPA